MDTVSQNSYWRSSLTDRPENCGALRSTVRADVAIVGGGITGLTAAMHLSRAGKKVVVLEAGRIGAGTTGETSGHLEASPDQGFDRLIHDFGAEAARELTSARLQAIDQIQRWCGELEIDCDFQRIPAVVFTDRAERLSWLHREIEGAKECGLPAEFVPANGGPYSCAGAMRVPNQARFHVMRYLNGLKQALLEAGVEIFEHTRAHVPEDGEPCKVQTDGGHVLADNVILATHSAYLGISAFDMQLAPYQSYMIAVRVAESLPDELFWDDRDPYYYYRLASSDSPNLLLAGGADHKTGEGDPQASFAKLTEHVSQRFTVQTVVERWSSEYFEPADGVPFIGRVPLKKNLYLAAGYLGTGLTFGTMAGLLLKQLLMGQATSLAKIVSPSRLKPLAAGGKLLTENLGVAKHFVGDRLSVETIDSLEQIQIGEGRVVRYRDQTSAIYRDEEGHAHVLSPVCVHAGCHVCWNTAEKTWDCPCHGGRYSATGERLYGPPGANLESRGHVAAASPVGRT
ncbi:MAG: FAD-dependent oxidoreductase [Pirellulaceae bacterium]